MTVTNSEAQLFIQKKLLRNSTASPLRLLACAFTLWWLRHKIETDIYMKGAFSPRKRRVKNGVLSRRPPWPEHDFSQRRPGLAHFLSSTSSVSHTKPDIHTPHGDGWAWPGHSARAERSSCSQVLPQLSLARLPRCAEPGGGGVVVGEPRGQKGAGIQGDSRLGRKLPGLFFAQHAREAKSRHVLADPYGNNWPTKDFSSYWFCA